MDALVRENLPLVKYVVRRFTGRGKEYEDLYQTGCIGLVKAIRNFDTEKELMLSTYAVPLIMGEIRRYLRDDNALHVSRSIRDACSRISAFTRSYEQENGRQPKLKAVCEALGMDAETAALAVNASMPVRSLSEPVRESSDICLEETIEGDCMEGLEDRLLIETLIGRLTEQERQIIQERYFDRRTQREIGERMGRTQVQISRMESRILRKMRSGCEISS